MKRIFYDIYDLKPSEYINFMEFRQDIHMMCAFKLLWCMVVLVSCNESTNQESATKRVEDSIEIVVDMAVSTYELSMQKQGLVNLQKNDSTIIVDLKYSSSDNFFGEDVYGVLQNAYLQKKPAQELKLANQMLQSINKDYRLLIYDAARPLSVQKILWQKLDSLPPKKRKDFVADPAEGSIHNYGCAVDLSIFDIKAQKELDMGTSYDFFGYRAYPRLEKQMLSEGKLSELQIENRQLLRKVMNANGFEAITSEWWHFNYYGRNRAKELYKIVE